MRIFKIWAIVDAARQFRNELVALDSVAGARRVIDVLVEILSAELDDPRSGKGPVKLGRVMHAALERIGIERRHVDLLRAFIEAAVLLYNALGVFKTSKVS